MQRCIALFGTDVVRTTRRNVGIFDQACPIVNSKLVASIASQTAFFSYRTTVSSTLRYRFIQCHRDIYCVTTSPILRSTLDLGQETRQLEDVIGREIGKYLCDPLPVFRGHFAKRCPTSLGQPDRLVTAIA